MKKITAYLAAFMMFSSLNVSAYENLYLCDGEISLDGKVNTGREGDCVTLMVLDGERDWNDKSVWMAEDGSGIAYFEEGSLDADRAYNFKFSLDKNGVYAVLVGSDEFSEAREENITYINKPANDSALSALTAEDLTESALQTFLENADNRDSLGMFGDFYAEVDYEAAAKMLLPCVKGKTLDCDTAISIIDRVCTAVLSNDGKINDIDPIQDKLHLDDTLKKYYRSEISGGLAAELKKTQYTSKDRFDDALRDGIVLCTVNLSDGTGDIVGILKDYRTVYSIDGSKITTGLATYLAKKAPFSDITALLDAISAYKVEESGGSSGGSSGGGSRGSSQVGMPVPVEAVEVNEAVNNNTVFFDMTDAEWANEAVTSLYYKGIINGVSKDEFKPNDNVKREEFAKILTKAFKIDVVTSEQYFDDVAPEDWCYDYVNSLYAAGGTSGISDRVFGKGMDISRQDICVMICRIIDMAKGTLNESGEGLSLEFSDKDEIADYASEAIRRMCSAGIISGYNDGSFKPNESATRAEAAKIIFETLARVSY